MQFAGQRTDLNLKPIGDPDIYYVKLTNDILPEPDAVLITGITPQKTLADGITEAEFLKHFYNKIATPGTVFLGFNNIRFDDEFIRFLNYRNFYDAYEWQWQGGKSKWDVLDLSRITRALRPDGIEWPFDSEGKPSNKLELLAKANKLDHFKAHDAASDIQATIAVAQLIKQKQPKLFDFMYDMRDKKRVEDLVLQPKPFIYCSGRYSSENQKTTAAITVTPHPTQKGTIFVYDLRVEPSNWAKKTPKELAEYLAKFKYEEDEERMPIKQLQFNRCPAVAPLSVLDEASQKRLKLNLEIVNQNLKSLLSYSDFAKNLAEAVKLNEQARQAAFIIDVNDVDSQLYDGFFNDADRDKMAIVRAAGQEKLADLHLAFNDARLEKLLMLYKARQYPKSLSDSEQAQYENYRQQKLLAGDDNSQAARYFARLNEISLNQSLTKDQGYLLEELKFYGESILPY
jgi:exodeoxyribonuclease I